MQTVTAHFDGRALVPDSPLDLTPGETVEVCIVRRREAGEVAEVSSVTPAPRVFRPLNIQIDPELSNAIARNPAFNIEES